MGRTGIRERRPSGTATLLEFKNENAEHERSIRGHLKENVEV